MAQVAIQTVAHPTADPLAALREACANKNEREVWRVSNELMFEMPFILAIQRRIVELIDEAFGAEYEGGWWSELGDDVSGYWASERDNHPEREAFDVAVVKGFYEMRGIAADRVRLAELSGRLTAVKPRIEEPKPEPPPKPVEWKSAILTKPHTIDINQPMRNAKNFAKDCLFLANEVASALGTWYYHEEWWQWNGRFYELAPERRIVDLIYNYLDAAVISHTDGTHSKFQLKPKHAEDLMKCLKARVSLHDKDSPPRWLDTDPKRSKPDSLLVFRNCMVDAETGKTYDLDPRLWIHDGLDFAYDPKAECPQWEKFLGQVFPNDGESHDCVEEFMGLGMTFDFQFEKGLGLIGVTRSGKGTIIRMMEHLAGPNGHTALDIHDWTRTENSRESLIGKKLGIFHDLRGKPETVYGRVGYDPGGISPHSAQLLLELISADETNIGRKYKQAWHGIPTAKIVIASNKVPNFRDRTLAEQRMVWLNFAVSFADCVDPNIKNKYLPAELPGIANRCLAGYRRLLKRGRFIQPESANSLAVKVREAVDWQLQFMNDCFVRDPEGQVTCSEFWLAFCKWRDENDRHDLDRRVTNNNLIRRINDMKEWHDLHSDRIGKEPRFYARIRKR
jgi:putative DNA primase/helicase